MADLAPRFPQGNRGVFFAVRGGLDICQSCAIITSIEKADSIRVISEENMKKILLFLLMLILAVACLTACGDDDDDDDDGGSRKKKKPTPTEEVTETPTPEGVVIGETETWGDLTVGVPTGWKFRKGDAFDEDDTRYCSVIKSDFIKYFDFKMETKEIMEMQYNYNKNTYTNEQTDVSGTFAGIEWTGFQYSDGWGGYGFELYAVVNEKPIRVSSVGFAFDSEEAAAILESIKIQ